MDHFARFGLPRRYEVDRAALDRAYERLSFEHHPDLLTGAGPERMQEAQQAAAQLNEGYRVLRSDAERAAYLLGLLQDGTAGGPPIDRERLPAGFLQEMFLLQEEVDELAADSAPQAKRQPLREQVLARHRQTLAERTQLFERAAAGASADALQAIQSNLNQEKYLLRLLERLQE